MEKRTNDEKAPKQRCQDAAAGGGHECCDLGDLGVCRLLQILERGGAAAKSNKGEGEPEESSSSVYWERAQKLFLSFLGLAIIIAWVIVCIHLHAIYWHALEASTYMIGIGVTAGVTAVFWSMLAAIGGYLGSL